MLLLPRTVPVSSESVASSSIFGSGKPRDINKPELKELEERLEQTLVLSRQQVLAAAAADAEAARAANSSSDALNTSPPNERLRTTSTTSSNNSNKK